MCVCFGSAVCINLSYHETQTFSSFHFIPSVTIFFSPDLCPFPFFASAILKLLMAGVEVHMQTPLLDVRHLGMAVGECLMNKLHKTTEDEPPLKLDYKASPEVIAVTKLAQPIAKQEEELKKETGSANVSKPLKMEPEPVKEEEEEEVVSGKGSPLAEKYGEGFVHAVQCSESDSDDDLVPYPMDEEDDPDVSKPAPPRYIRSLMQGMHFRVCMHAHAC